MQNGQQFGLVGVDRVTLAVEKLDDARRFATDWGLEKQSEAESDAFVFRTIDGSEVEVMAADAERPDRTPIGAPSGIVRITWGVDREGRLEAIANELARDRQVSWSPDGSVQSVDDLGLGLSFRVAQRRTVPFACTTFNAPGQPARINSRAARYERARPHEISHVAINVDHAAEASAFYVNRLGFRISDRYADRGVFLRCSPEGNHHHLFLMNGRDPGVKFNHLAFKVRDIHEVIAGGQYVDSKGWATFAGPGRHIISSACFWYFLTPFGGSWEYAADEDVVTEEWEAQDFAALSHIFSEWTFGVEKSDGTLRGPISQSAARPQK